MIRRITLAVVACAWASSAAASADLECEGSSQIEIRSCVADMEKRVEQALQLIVQQAEAQATELDDITGRVVALPALKAAQSSWEQYRDTECDYAGALFGGGSGTGIAIHACRIELTRARMRVLQSRR